jgi:hypothetical protein
MRSERGGLARELAVGIIFTLLVWGAFIGSAAVLVRSGHVSTGRVVGAAPLVFLGIANGWLVVRPGDAHEARPWARCGSAIRAFAFLIPSVWFIVAPSGLGPLATAGIVLLGLIASFVVPIPFDREAV